MHGTAGGQAGALLAGEPIEEDWDQAELRWARPKPPQRRAALGPGLALNGNLQAVQPEPKWLEHVYP